MKLIYFDYNFSKVQYFDTNVKKN